MRILVTGGAGFIGSHLAAAFVDEGHDVEVVDDLSSGRQQNLQPSVRLHKVDIRSDAVDAVFAAFRPDVLCHQAAQMDVRRSVAEPVFDAEVNVVGTLRLLECCKRYGVKRVLFASTGGAIYGEQDHFPASEEHPTRPVSPYGVAKLAVERYLYFYQVEYGFRPAVLRYANVYGPRQNPHGEAGVVAIFCERLLRREPVTIYGDGEQTRDFIHVADVVAANLSVLGSDAVGTFNVGTGVETSVNRIAEHLGALFGSSQVTRAAAKPGEQKRSSVDSRKLQASTSWRPRYSVADGLSDYARWCSSAGKV